MIPPAFVDEADIEVTGGHGGRGKVSFERTRHRPRGGPDGGNAGNGGHVFARGRTKTGSLVDYERQRCWSAAVGADGAASNKHGAAGKDLVLFFPPGTDVSDAVTGDLHTTIRANKQTEILARGGCGGRGNASYKSSVNRAPRQSSLGEPGQGRSFRLNLRLPADVALLGRPSAGKSSLLAALSNARPEIAEYQFTTMHPQLGVHETEDYQSFVLVELPGITSGSEQGAALGRRFLRHASRCRLLLLLVACSGNSEYDIVNTYNMLDNVIKKYSDEYPLSEERMLVLSKADLSANNEAARLACQAGRLTGVETCCVSVRTGEGLSGLVSMLAGRLGGSGGSGD